ncbi:hypothetical protein Tco_1300087 [Tanacetum coccineum]
MDDEFIRQDIRRLFYGRFSFYDPSVEKIKEVKQETDVTQKDEKRSQIGQNRAREQKELKRQKSGSKSQQKVNPDKAKVNPVKLNQENVT